jgi:hypothetical protein
MLKMRKIEDDQVEYQQKIALQVYQSSWFFHMPKFSSKR